MHRDTQAYMHTQKQQANTYTDREAHGHATQACTQAQTCRHRHAHRDTQADTQAHTQETQACRDTDTHSQTHAHKHPPDPHGCGALVLKAAADPLGFV